MSKAEVLTLERPVPRVAERLIAIASGKGGVGKTWLSVSLAQALAQRGLRVLLFDGDLGLANVDVQLGLAPERDLGGVFAGRYGLEEAILTQVDGGFSIVAGASGSGRLAGLPPERLRLLAGQLLRLAGRYDRVLLDLGAGIEGPVRQLASLAGTCLVVTTDEPTAITDAYAFIKLALAARPTADLRIVVNMAESAAAGERTYGTLRRACATFLHATPAYAGAIRRDSRVKQAIRAQLPFLMRHPTAPAAMDVEALAGRLVGPP